MRATRCTARETRSTPPTPGTSARTTRSHRTQPVRWLAEGRDAPATIDSAMGGFGKNDGDNEITGLLVSNGDASADGILGAEAPNLGDKKWRWFYTQQHGDNVTYEVLLSSRRD